MRISLILCTVLLTAASPVLAQVTLDLHALQALPERKAANLAPRPAPRIAPDSPAVVTRVAPLAEPAAQPALPESVPVTASIMPISPSAAPTAAPPPPVSDKATTEAATTKAGLRLTFAPGESDLSPDSRASIKTLADATPVSDAATFNVLAYAPGKPDDPSTARRVSLSRAMAVRSALVADGVPSARIFVRALGDQRGDGPPDRVDLSITGTTTNTATAR